LNSLPVQVLKCRNFLLEMKSQSKSWFLRSPANFEIFANAENLLKIGFEMLDSILLFFF
jgi:hypothetical protein